MFPSNKKPKPSFSNRHKQSSQWGFTLVELVTVVLLLSILALVGMPKFFGQNSFREMGFADASLSSLRLAQKLAMASGCDTRVVFNSNGYQVWQRAACTTGGFSQAINLPGQDAQGAGTFSGVAPNSVSVPWASLYFDASGSPTLQSGALPIVLGSRSINVEAVTGFVHLL